MSTARISEAMMYSAGRDLADAMRKPFGSDKWNVIGALCISGAYGGFQLQEFVNDCGGIRNLTSGFLPKRELYYQLRAMLAGAHMANAAKEQA